MRIVSWDKAPQRSPKALALPVPRTQNHEAPKQYRCGINTRRAIRERLQKVRDSHPRPEPRGRRPQENPQYKKKRPASDTIKAENHAAALVELNALVEKHERFLEIGDAVSVSKKQQEVDEANRMSNNPRRTEQRLKPSWMNMRPRHRRFGMELRLC
ncbi:hypothetical protein Ddc_23517 [Ditylenchus destructor]|nr:hypothetical protein Ddc_23517 [Ditylenchus destructor]